MTTGYTTSTDNTTFGTTGDFEGTLSASPLYFTTGDFNGTTSTFILNTGGEITVEGFKFKETSDGNFIEVVKREKPNPNFTLTIYPYQEQTDRVFKEIYGVTSENGRQVLKLIQTIEGNVTPGHYVDESVSFDE